MTTQLTHIPPPLDADQQLAADLLTCINLKPRSLAEALASQHPFARIRDCVAHWWLNRRSVGGIFLETPGIVIHWLNHFDSSSIPSLHPDFYATDLYHRFRPASELQAERDDAETRLTQEVIEWRAQTLVQLPSNSTVDIPPPYAVAWQSLITELKLRTPSALYLSFIEKNLLLTHVQEPPPQLTFTITLQDPTTKDWIKRQLTNLLQRSLSTILHQPVTVTFLP